MLKFDRVLRSLEYVGRQLEYQEEKHVTHEYQLQVVYADLIVLLNYRIFKMTNQVDSVKEAELKALTDVVLNKYPI